MIDAKYVEDVFEFADYFYIQVKKELAKKFLNLMECPLDKSFKEFWTEQVTKKTKEGDRDYDQYDEIRKEIISFVEEQLLGKDRPWVNPNNK